MSWKQKLIDHATTHGCEIIDCSDGLGMVFDDGCDVFWILPGEPTSTIPLEPDADIDTTVLIADFDRMGALRGKVLHVIRHHLAERGFHVERNPNGSWGYSSKWMSAGLDAGAQLTEVIRSCFTLADVFHNWHHFLWTPDDAPTPAKLEEWLAKPVPENVSRKFEESGHGIEEAAGWLGICTKFQRLAEMSDEDLKQTIQQAVNDTSQAAIASPESELIAALAKLMPAENASANVCGAYILEIDFADGLAEFRLRPWSGKTQQRLAAAGPQRTAEQIASEYHRLNTLRSRALGAIVAAAAEMNWIVERISFAIFGGVERFYIGETTREIAFEAGNNLTRRISKMSPEDAFARVFPDRPDFALRCVAAFEDESVALTQPLKFGQLQPKLISSGPPLLALTPDLVKQTDDRAAAVIDNVFRDPAVLWLYKEDDFITADDKWFESDRWLEAALTAQKTDSCYDAAAALILLDHGHPAGESAARKIVQLRTYGHHEEDDNVVELIWRLRHEFPEIAREWFGPGKFSECYHDKLVALGDPVSLWRQKGEACLTDDNDDDNDDDDELTAEIVRTFQQDRQTEILNHLTDWAREVHLLSPIDDDKLRLAADMNWKDVFSSLETNPWLRSVWFDIDDREDQFDEPGLLIGSVVLVIWSKVLPSEFLARLVATGFKTDFVELAETAARRSRERRPSEQEAASLSTQMYESFNRQLQVNLAIAWNRCRHLINSL